MQSEHFRAVDAITEAELVPGVRTRIPVGYFTVDGTHRGFRTPAPAAGADAPRWSARTAAGTVTAERSAACLPLAGLRIVDLGVIVAGGELSRLFGDLGAEVIKVESTAYPDGLRQGRPGQLLTESFAWTHRNSLGLGLELRTPGGAEVFAQLVSHADAVFANFKPGTLAGLGFPYEELRRLNPRIVLAESSAFGDAGPWSARMGYGPLVRASTGVTALWTGPGEGDRHPFFDATTVFPDHVVGRITAVAALAALIHRDATGAAARVHISQAEAGVNQLDTLVITREALAEQPGLVEPGVRESAVYPCRGDDEWCVVSVESDADRRAAIAVMGPPQRWPDWTRARTPAEAAEELQAAGVAAAPMNRRPDVLADPQLVARKLYRRMEHPLLDQPLPAEAGPAPFRHIGPARQHPAPLPGQDTREICRRILGFDEPTIDGLVADGVLFGPGPV